MAINWDKWTIAYSVRRINIAWEHLSSIYDTRQGVFVSLKYKSGLKDNK